MFIEYDEETDAAFVWLVNEVEAARQEVAAEIWPSELGEKVGLLLDAQRKILALEILFASGILRPEFLARQDLRYHSQK